MKSAKSLLENLLPLGFIVNASEKFYLKSLVFVSEL